MDRGSSRDKRRTLRALGADRRAATAIEYGFILALICLAAMASIIIVANKSAVMWNGVSNKVQSAE